MKVWGSLGKLKKVWESLTELNKIRKVSESFRQFENVLDAATPLPYNSDTVVLLKILNIEKIT